MAFITVKCKLALPLLTNQTLDINVLTFERLCELHFEVKQGLDSLILETCCFIIKHLPKQLMRFNLNSLSDFNEKYKIYVDVFSMKNTKSMCW